MTILDAVLTPIYLILIFAGAYLIRPYVTDKSTRPYFLPGLIIRIVGAIALGFIYQFYYSGGDTYNYYYNSTQIYNAFLENPVNALKLLAYKKKFDPELFPYISKMYFYHDSASYFVIRVAAFFSFFSFNSYLVISCFFALFSFSGLWCLLLTLKSFYPQQIKYFALSVLFLPSIVFWGSGLLKDTLTLGAVGWATWSVYMLFFNRKRVLLTGIILVLACYIIFSVKIYILICLLPAFIIWIVLRRLKSVQSSIIKVIIAPFIILVAISGGYYAIKKVGEDNSRYNLEKITETAEATARWLSYVSEKDQGAGYSLGDFDYSPSGMLQKLIPAINVTLFRPYLWEINSVVMLLSALESFIIFLLTIYTISKAGFFSVGKLIMKDPNLVFFLFFSLSFAFAVGVSTYNFGSLVRYKIPMLPFYLAALIVIIYSNRARKLARLAKTEKRSSTLARA